MMFRISQYMQDLNQPGSVKPLRKPAGPVVIWNLIRRCNLTCKHCYSISADIDFPGELSTQQVFNVMQDLRAFGVSVLILSGGEPLLRTDIYEIARYAKTLGFYIGLSSNGTLINEGNITRIADVGFDYLGISIDGLRENHDKFRQKVGSFDQSLHAAQLCKQHNIKVGLRFTLTQDNFVDLPALLDIVDEYDLEKFYLSHLNYSGRGKRNRNRDAYFQTTRLAMDLLFERAWKNVCDGVKREYVTGNNDADGVYLLHWARRKFTQAEDVCRLQTLQYQLQQWGGNSSGVNIANIDNTGTVHPDTFWWNHDLGNVKQKPFSEIWGNSQDELMVGLRQRPRPVKGRCERCNYLAICGGNTRVRAYSMDGDFWGEDPGCYLHENEITLSKKCLPEEVMSSKQLLKKHISTEQWLAKKRHYMSQKITSVQIN